MVQTWRLRKMTSVCIQLVVIVVTMSLSDVVCQTVHNINISDEVHSGRQRRQAQLGAQPLTQQQRSEIVDHHNVLRARESADNMELMMWKASLASLAATWAASCRWEHPNRANHPEYNNVGQNLWAGTYTTIDLTSAIDAWYNEKNDYTYDTMDCVPNKMCGHYTQVVWATSSHVGCAVHRCASVAGMSRGLYLVCNYSPAGNMDGSKPYTKGPYCTKCGSGAGWCKNKLCDSTCSGAGKGCKCAAICYNCAKLDLKTCQCSCVKGWLGPDCKARCEDTHANCNANPGWPPSMCNVDYVKAGCPAMCGLCTPDPNAVADQCPPRRASPDPSKETKETQQDPAHSAQMMFTNSHQSTMIFVMVIITFIINSYDLL